ncbi:MAG: hypothetical protein IJY50_03620 [Clostridia bacterium]|nr:hypothetical protein [Clostridia bacterium]
MKNFQYRGLNVYCKQYEIVTDADKISVDIQKTCMERKTIKKWAYILHDKDDTRPHYHIYINFGNSGINSADVAEWFGVPENFIEKVKGRYTDMLLYLTHGNDSQQNKHQYSASEVVANFDFQTEIMNSKILGDFEKYSYAQQLAYVNSLPVSEKSTAFNKLQTLWKLHCQCLMLKPDRNVEVVFVCGKGGTGKTYYAKKLLTSLDYDYCVSSSSNDPFQDYMGQKAIILDDLRDQTFEFADLLKILDNNTASSVRSRFANKVFNGEMIVITSTVPLSYWYYQYKSSQFDTIQQLYRRISCYVVVTDSYINVYDALDNMGRPTGPASIFKNELKKRDKAQDKKTDFGRVFGKICEDAMPEYLEEMCKKAAQKGGGIY